MLFGRSTNKWSPNLKKTIAAGFDLRAKRRSTAHARRQVKEGGLQEMPGYTRCMAEIRLHLGELQQRTWGNPFFATVHGQDDEHTSHSIEPMPGYTLPEMPG